MLLASIHGCVFSSFSQFVEFQFLNRILIFFWHPWVLLHFYFTFVFSVLYKSHSWHHVLLVLIDRSEHIYWCYLNQDTFSSQDTFYFKNETLLPKKRALKWKITIFSSHYMYCMFKVNCEISPDVLFDVANAVECVSGLWSVITLNSRPSKL